MIIYKQLSLHTSDTLTKICVDIQSRLSDEDSNSDISLDFETTVGLKLCFLEDLLDYLQDDDFRDNIILFYRKYFPSTVPLVSNISKIDTTFGNDDTSIVDSVWVFLPDGSQKKQVQLYLNAALNEYNIENVELLLINNQEDVSRKNIHLDIDLSTQMFPFLAIHYDISPNKTDDYLMICLESLGAKKVFSEPRIDVKDRSLSIVDVVYDMETNDLDDILALLVLLGSPYVNLKGITVNPGDSDQIGLVYSIVDMFSEKHIDIGGNTKKSKKKSVSHVSPWYKNVYEWTPVLAKLSAVDVLKKNCDHNTTLVTGGALTNVAAALGADFNVGRLVSQGGFAGTNIMKPENVLEKFKDAYSQPTFNFNSNLKAVNKVFSDKVSLGKMYFVSKNVCHRVLLKEEELDAIQSDRPYVGEIKRLLSQYNETHDDGKKLHDVLAACCAVNCAIGDWRSVKFVNDGPRCWAADPDPSTGVHVILDYSHLDFKKYMFSL